MTSKLHIYDYWWLFQKSGQWNSHVWWQFIFINYFENCDARKFTLIFLTLSWLKSLLYKNQFIDLLCKSVDWFLYDTDLLHERVKVYWRTQKRQRFCSLVLLHVCFDLVKMCFPINFSNIIFLVQTCF